MRVVDHAWQSQIGDCPETPARLLDARSRALVDDGKTLVECALNGEHEGSEHGVLVIYLTRDTRVDAEKLIYYVENSATFTSTQGNVRIVTLAVTNTGTRSAHNLKIVADFGQNASIEDRKITLSSAPAATFKNTVVAGRLDVELENFPPTEAATVSMLVKEPGEQGSSSSTPSPKVGVQSNDSIGELVSLSSLTPNKNAISRPVRYILAGLVAFGFILQFLLLTLFRKTLGEKLRRVFPSPTSPNLNNTAFLYLQQGLLDDAVRLLERTISTDGADAITLANYALSLGLRGDSEGALKRFEAAEWWANTSHERAVIEYDIATLHLAHGRFLEGKEHLSKALSLSRLEIGRYCRLSVYVRSAAEKDPEIRLLAAAKR